MPAVNGTRVKHYINSKRVVLLDMASKQVAKSRTKSTAFHEDEEIVVGTQEVEISAELDEAEVSSGRVFLEYSSGALGAPPSSIGESATSHSKPFVKMKVKVLP